MQECIFISLFYFLLCTHEKNLYICFNFLFWTDLCILGPQHNLNVFRIFLSVGLCVYGSVSLYVCDAQIQELLKIPYEFISLCEISFHNKRGYRKSMICEIYVILICLV